MENPNLKQNWVIKCEIGIAKCFYNIFGTEGGKIKLYVVNSG